MSKVIMKRIKPILLLSALLVIVFSSGCAHISDQKKYDKLSAKQKFFWKALRWKSYDSAASVIKFKNEARTLAPIDDLNQITVTAYEEIGVMELAEDELNDVKIVVLFDYIQNQTGKVKQVKHVELWWYEEETKQWYLDSDMPAFKVN
jgi:hypothetical protein